MQIRLTNFSTGKVLAAFAEHGFGVVRNDNLLRGHAGSDAVLETAAIWTEDGEGDNMAGGFEIGLIRRELTTFSASHELVLETNRIPQERLMALLARIASENR